MFKAIQILHTPYSFERQGRKIADEVTVRGKKLAMVHRAILYEVQSSKFTITQVNTSRLDGLQTHKRYPSL